MSVNANRLSLEEAKAAATCIVGLWGLHTPDVLLVGSARRQRESVGDLEFTCRRPAECERDVLFEAMSPTVRLGGLFAADDERPEVVAEALRGFSPHFGYADLIVDLTRTDGHPFRVRVQIHRWDPDGLNRGWIEIMRTGPVEFGMWFLKAWKRRWDLKGEASIDGRLVDGAGQQVPVRTELEAFKAAGMNYVEPDRRDAVALASMGQKQRTESFLRR